LLLALGGLARHQGAEANRTLFGPNVYVFDPGMAQSDIQQTADTIFSKMEANQFGPERVAFLFKPGAYHVAFNVGFYTQVAGLGLNPDDVQIDGGTDVPAHWMKNANATCNFWRSFENYAVTPSSNNGILQIAVSQAAPIRRLHVKGELRLFAFSERHAAGWASGGFLADSIVDGKVTPGSQQQWLSRNSTWSKWTSGNWNMVFVGCQNAPPATFPIHGYTVVDKTPVIREKPYLYVDQNGGYRVFVPALRRDSQDVSWASGPTPGTSISLDRFYVAHPESSTAGAINRALAKGKHVLFTPGIYRLDQPLRVTSPDTILMGLGFATLIPTQGQPIISAADVDGVKIAALILDAGPAKSPSLLEVGQAKTKVRHTTNPTCLYDLTVRTGGATAGLNDDGIRIESNDVVADQIWLWRADHGASAQWIGNPTKHGLVVDGDHVTVYGLFNEHHEEYQTLWNGEDGRVYMYQSEMPYDVPDQAAWGPGYASYKVADHVTRHEAWGVGIYCFFRDAAIKAPSAVEAPTAPGVRFHNLATLWLSGHPGSQITHVINQSGEAATQISHHQTLNEYPGQG
jgi:hypothetical protein